MRGNVTVWCHNLVCTGIAALLAHARSVARDRASSHGRGRSGGGDPAFVGSQILGSAKGRVVKRKKLAQVIRPCEVTWGDETLHFQFRAGWLTQEFVENYFNAGNEKMMEGVAKLIADWDIEDEDEEGNSIPTQPSQEIVSTLPVGLIGGIAEAMQKAAVPDPEAKGS